MYAISMCTITCRQGELHVCLPLLSSSVPSCNSIDESCLATHWMKLERHACQAGHHAMATAGEG